MELQNDWSADHRTSHQTLVEILRDARGKFVHLGRFFR